MNRHSSAWANRFHMILVVVLFLPALVLSCDGGGGRNGEEDHGGGVSITTGEYVVLAWNDLGMHCLNPTYDQLIILPPYNTLWAQVIERGNPPRVVTNGIEVSYAIVNNTSSADKLSFGQFWDADVLSLFGADGLAPNTGLNLHDPSVNNGLSGTMQLVGDHFQADGIPVTPVEDGATTKNPYQVARITLARASDGVTLAQTQAMVPTSDEINCGLCHAPGGTVTDAFVDILEEHDESSGTSLEASAPVLCAQCHGSPALGSPAGERGSSGMYLSEAIHGFHAGQTTPSGNAQITCYDCHPGEATKCNRSLAHTAADGDCITCHGTMVDMAADISDDVKIPWVNEPQCITCHTGVAEVNTGSTLYRNATGHGNLYCAACHQSPHAMVPSREAADNYQAQQYQDRSVTIGSCRVCHGTSRPEGGQYRRIQRRTCRDQS